MKLLSAILCIAAIAALAASGARAEDSNVAEGHQLFMRYCASCHGVEAIGNGPVATTLDQKPANLRMLSDKYGSPLPVNAIAEFIDGRKAIRAHGTGDMPVWGARFYNTKVGDKGDAGVSDAIKKIVAYLNSI